jgi:thiamine biosynthesis lipoprotein
MNRRDFLGPRNLAHQTGQIFGAIDDLDKAGVSAPETPVSILRASFRAMATEFEVLLPYGLPRAHEIFREIFSEIDRLEQQLTVYRDSSEVSQLNRLAPSGAIQIEHGLFGLLALSKQISLETDGAFDITAGALVKAWGFFRGPQRVPSADEIESALERVGMQYLELDGETRSVHYHRNVEINLGSIGKGYALDCVAKRLRQGHGFEAALLHGGHSSIYAIGSQPGTKDGWPIAIRHPWDAERRLGMVRLRDQAMGTSAATYRHVECQGRKLGHILDPRTGWPAEGIASASVIAPTAAEADALATAFFILGMDRAREYCKNHPAVSAILLPEDQASEAIGIGVSLEETSFCEV